MFIFIRITTHIYCIVAYIFNLYITFNFTLEMIFLMFFRHFVMINLYL